MKQMSFADAEYAGKRKQTRRERFLIEMDQVVPWKGLIALIEPHYPKGEGRASVSRDQAPVRLYESAFSWFVEKQRAADDVVHVVESVDGAKTVHGYGRGASVMQADRPEAARLGERTMN